MRSSWAKNQRFAYWVLLDGESENPKNLGCEDLVVEYRSSYPFSLKPDVLDLCTVVSDSYRFVFQKKLNIKAQKN